jgi:hypothetical protein
LEQQSGCKRMRWHWKEGRKAAGQTPSGVSTTDRRLDAEPAQARIGRRCRSRRNVWLNAWRDVFRQPHQPEGAALLGGGRAALFQNLNRFITPAEREQRQCGAMACAGLGKSETVNTPGRRGGLAEASRSSSAGDAKPASGKIHDTLDPKP